MVPNVIERVWVQGTTTKVESLRGTAFTEEDGAHTFRIAGVDASGETVPLSGTVLAKILRADNITIDVSGTITDGVASVTMVGDCYHVPGRFSIVVYLSDGVTTIAIYAAVGDIYRATSDTELDSGTTVPSLVQLEAAYQNALSAAAAANTAATGAERVNVSMSKSGDTITFSATDRTGATTTETMSDQSEAVANLNSAFTNVGKNLIHDNLLENAGLTSGKILQWSDGTVVDGANNYYCTTVMIPCSVHDFPLYVVDKDMTLKSKVYQFFTYNLAGGMATHGNNVDVPCDVNRPLNSAYVASARITLDRTAFGDADENGTWAWVFTAQQYAKHVSAQSVYLYEDAPVSNVAENANVPRPLKSGIANVTALIDSGIMKRNTVNLFDASIAYTGYSIDPLGYVYEDSSQSTATIKNYIIDCMNLQPNTEYAFTYGAWLINKAYWLDADGNPMSDVGLSQNDYVKTSPNGAYGARCLVLNLTSDKQIMICEGDTLPAYTDYNDGVSIKDEFIPGSGGGSEEIWEAIGDLNNLQTTEKNNLVSAINEAAQSGGGGGSGDGGQVLIHDNLLENADITSGKILQWSDGAVVDGASNYYCTATMIPCSVHDFPLYVVDKDMTLKSKVYQFFTYNLAGGMATRGNNVDVPCDVNRAYQSAYVAFARFTLDRTAFGEADESGNWAFVFTAEQYAKHVSAGSAYLYENAPSKRITVNTNIERAVKTEIANADALTDSGFMRHNSRNLLDKSQAESDCVLDPRGYPYATTSTNFNYYVVDSLTLRPNTNYSFTFGTWLINTAFWLDQSGNPISKIALDSTHYTFTSPSNAYGVRCAVTTNGGNTLANAKIAVYEGDTLLDYEEYYAGKVIRDDYLPGFKHWNKYKYYSIGDSRTAGAGCSDRSKAYPKVIQQMTGIVNVNAAVDGAAYCQRPGISIPTMYEQAAQAPTDTDIVTIFGGTNDRIIGVVGSNLNPTYERGTLNYYVAEADKYDVTTFRGAIRQTIKNLKLRCPAATIILMVDDLIESPDGDPQSDAKFIYSGSTAWTKAVDGGASESDMIREVAEEYGLPVIDVSKIAMTGRGGDEYLASEYKPFTDSLHESDFGNEMLARAVAGEMAKYLW